MQFFLELYLNLTRNLVRSLFDFARSLNRVFNKSLLLVLELFFFLEHKTGDHIMYIFFTGQPLHK